MSFRHGVNTRVERRVGGERKGELARGLTEGTRRDSRVGRTCVNVNGTQGAEVGEKVWEEGYVGFQES